MPISEGYFPQALADLLAKLANKVILMGFSGFAFPSLGGLALI
jgi:hypothetical protein